VYNCHASNMLVGAAGRYHSAAAGTSAIYSFLQLLLFQPASLLVFDPLGAQRGRCGALLLAQCVPLLLLVRGQRGQRVQPPRRAGSAAGSAPVARSAPPMRARWAKAAVVPQRGVAAGAAVVAVGGVASPAVAGVSAAATTTAPRFAARRPACRRAASSPPRRRATRRWPAARARAAPRSAACRWLCALQRLAVFLLRAALPLALGLGRHRSPGHRAAARATERGPELLVLGAARGGGSGRLPRWARQRGSGALPAA